MSGSVRGQGHSAGQERTHSGDTPKLSAANEEPGGWEALRLCGPWSNWSNEIQHMAGPGQLPQDGTQDRTKQQQKGPARCLLLHTVYLPPARTEKGTIIKIWVCVSVF